MDGLGCALYWSQGLFSLAKGSWDKQETDKREHGSYNEKPSHTVPPFVRWILNPPSLSRRRVKQSSLGGKFHQIVDRREEMLCL